MIKKDLSAEELVKELGNNKEEYLKYLSEIQSEIIDVAAFMQGYLDGISVKKINIKRGALLPKDIKKAMYVLGAFHQWLETKKKEVEVENNVVQS